MPESLDALLVQAGKPETFAEQQGKHSFRKPLVDVLAAVAAGTAYHVIPNPQNEAFAQGNLELTLAAGVSGGLAAAAVQRQRQQQGSFQEHQLPWWLRYDFLAERPVIPAAISGLSMTALVLGNHFSSRAWDEIAWLQTPYTAGLFGILAGGLTYATAVAAGMLFHHHSAQVWSRRLLAVVFRNKRLQMLKGIAQLPHSREKNAALQIEMAEEHFRSGRLADASKGYVTAMHAMTSETPYRGISDWAVPSPARAFSSQRLVSRDGGGQLHCSIREGTRAFFQDELAKAEACFLNAVGQSIPANARLPHLARARFLQAAAQQPLHHAKADLELRIYALRLLRDPDVQWRRFGEARNEVLLPQSLGWDAAEDVIVKRSTSAAHIADEAATTALFHRYFGTSVSNPVLQLEEAGYHHLIMENAGKETLLDLVREKRHTADDFSRAAGLLARIHHFGEKNIAEGNLSAARPAADHNYYTSRIATVFLQQLERHRGVFFKDDFKQELLQSYSVINDALQEAPLTFYKDANLRNWIKGQRLAAIDFEQARLLPGQLDLVNLLEFQYDYLTERQRATAMRRYLSELERQRGKKFGRSERRAFLQLYSFAAVQRHLELIGYRARDADTDNERQRAENLAAERFHYEKTLAHLDRIISRNDAPEKKHELLRLRETLASAASGFTSLQPPTKVRQTLEDLLGSWKLRAGIAAATCLALVTAATVMVSMRNRNIPVIDMPLTSPQHILFVEQMPTHTDDYTLPQHTFRLYAALLHGSPTPLATTTSPAVSISPLGDKALYTTSEGIVLTDLVSGAAQLQLAGKGFTSASWSPDGLRIFATQNQNGITSSFRLDTKSPNMIFDILTGERAASLQWSPDSASLSFLAETAGGYTINTVSAFGLSRAAGPLLGTAVQPHTWSPDSTQLLYVRQDRDTKRIFRTSSHFTQAQLLYTAPPSTDITYLSWPAADTAIAWLVPLNTGEKAQLLRIDVPSGTAATIFAGMQGIPSLSPDRHFMAYACNGDVCLHDFSRKATTKLTATIAQESDPSFVRNDTLAFLIHRNGIADVGMAHTDGTGYRRLTANANPEKTFLLPQ